MIRVTKASGEFEPLSLDKVRSSLRRAGADAPVIDKILLQVKPALYDKIATAEIYRLVFSLYRQYRPRLAGHYGLKPALLNLGPSGHPFEDFIARLFEAMGYQTSLRQMVAGRCVSHEIDIIAQNRRDRFLIECKFHQRAGNKCDVKTALYVQARFEDIGQKHPGVYTGMWLVTNTKLTGQAVVYGRCRGLNLLAWRYPGTGGLEQLIDKFNLYHLLI